MGIGDIRYTLLEVVNEVMRKLDLSTVTVLSQNKLSIQMVDFINDICSDLSDFGNWQETMVTANVTAVSGQADYSINTSANVKNIGDIFFSNRSGALRSITVEDMRMLSRSSALGTPTQYTVFGTDNNGNPNIRVRPRPGSTDDGGLFSILYWIRTPKYTTSDGSTLIPFPGEVVVHGVHAMALLNEAGGAPTNQYTAKYNDYLQARKEAFNRFNGDSGWSVSFTPSLVGRRRR